MVAAVRRAKSWWQAHPKLSWGVFLSTLCAGLVFGVFVALAITTVTAVSPSPTTVNTTAAYTFTGAQTTAKLERVSSFAVTFPANVDTSGIADNGCVMSWTAGGGGTETSTAHSDAGNTVTFTMPASTAPGNNAAVTFTVSGVGNPSQPGSYSISGTIRSGTTGAYNGTTTNFSGLTYTATASATAVTAVTATPSTTTEYSAAAYTVGFTTGAAGRLAGNPAAGANSIVVTFPAGTTVPASPSVANVTIAGVNPQAVSVAGQAVTLTLAAGQTINSGTAVAVVFNSSFGLMNPGAGSPTLQVFTSAQTNIATSAAYTITAAPTTVTIGDNNAADPAAANVNTLQALVPVDAFSLQRSGGSKTSTIGRVTVTDTGTGVPANTVATAYIYTDGGTLGVIDGSDASIGSGTFSGVGTTVDIDITDQVISDNTTRNFMVVYSFANSPTAANNVTANAEVTAATWSGFDTLSILDDDDTPNDFTVRYTVLTIGDSTDPAGSTVTPGQTGVTVDRFTTARSGGTRATTLDTVTIADPGTAGIISTAYIYTDGGTLGVIDGSDASIGSVASPSFPATIDITDQPADGTTRNYLVVYDISGSAGGGGTASGEITSVAYSNADTLVNNDDDTPQVFTVLTPVTVTVGDGTSLTGSTVSPNTSNLVLDAFTLTSSAGGTVSTVTVTKTETGNADSTTVAIYSDANGNGVVDGTDASIVSGAYGAALTINQTVSTTPLSYTVVASVGSSATDGATLTGRVTAATGTGVGSFTYNDTTSRTVTVQHTIVAVGPGVALSSPVNVIPGQTNVEIDTFTLARSQGSQTPVVSAMTITKTGTATVASPQVRIYTDGSTIGLFDGGDTMIGSGNFNESITLTAPQTINASKNYLVVVFIDSAATPGTSVTGTLTNAVGTSVDSFTYGDNTSRTANVVTPPTTVEIGNAPADPTGVSLSPGQSGAVLDRFRIQRTAGTEAATVNRITITNSGTAPLNSAYIYTDNNIDGSIAGETLLGTAAFVGASADIDIVPDESVGALGAPKYYVVACDVGAATDGQTAIIRATAATGGGTPVPTFTFTDTANTFTVTVAPPDTTPPTAPAITTVTPGVASPTIATIAWTASTDDTGVALYRVFRSQTADFAAYVEVGSTAGLTLADTSGLPGTDYYYRVRAYDAVSNESAWSNTGGPVNTVWGATPHATYSDTTKLCKVCHAPHDAASSSAILRDTGGAAGELSLCYTCHDGSGASLNILAGVDNSFALASGHAMENVEVATDYTNSCSSCHSPHRDYESNASLPRAVINGASVTTADNTWCLACHNDGNDWYENTTPAKTYTYSVDATGYPTTGTFAGATVYNNAAVNAHVTIPATAGIEREAGDCLYCHDSHRSNSAYDLLVARFQPSTAATLADDQANGSYAALCFKCHGDNDYGFATPPTNIKQYVTAGGQRSGHRIKTAGGTYEVGAPLPCYECHNPHGSSNANQHLFSDVLGSGLKTTTAAPTPAQELEIRQFCFTCHTTAGDDKTTPDNVAYGWDSSGAGEYVAVAAGSKVAGLARDAAIDANVVRLPAVNGHYRDDTQSCYKCHGKSYDSAASNNVHNPSGGVSAGGEACYACHTSYQVMEDQAGAKTGGAEALNVYHHVLGVGGATPVEGDDPFTPTTYPSGFSGGLYCLTCHVDHDKFNAAPGSNLRTTGASSDATPTDTDYGVCYSCHGLPMERSLTEQKPSTLYTQAVTGYGTSAHQYTVTSEFGTGNTFRAECSKCHNDEQAKEFQTSANTFGTHWSAERNILSALGGSASDPLGETHCYGCHTGGTAGNDKYGAKAMTASARSTQAEFALTGSKHPVVATGSGAGNINSVECANCHNPHAVTATNKVSDPSNTYNTYVYADGADAGTDAATEKSAFCLKCHSSAALPTYTVGATLVPSTVTIADSAKPLMDKSANAARAHWSTGGAISDAERVACGDCHDNHASSAPKLLGRYNPADGKNYIGTTEITANTNAVCYGCHTAATTSFPAGEAQRETGTGYLNAGTWPGMTAYATVYAAATHTGSPHATIPASGDLVQGDCKHCHDVHGTQYKYDELTGQFDPKSAADDDFDLCFSCHSATGIGADIESLYPTTAGGSSGDVRSGHRVLSDTSALAAETLSKDQAVPCYDCHNPHGSASSYSLQVRDVGDEAGDAFDMTTVATRGQNVSRFCFTCHVPSDASEGWGDTGAGAGWVTLTTEVVEGIPRTNAAYKLKLPALDDHKKLAGTDCLGCHTDPHQPSGGISNGGVDCYGCHKSYQETMDADGTSKTTSYHHVMGTGGGTYNGDTAFASGSYPAAGTDVYCMSCHVDHDTFNSNKANNLRADMTATSAGAATDYVASGSYGVCVGCHASSRAKDRTNQANDGLTGDVPAIGGALYGSSAHQYAVTSTFDDPSTFTANCVKCHDDAGDAGYQTGNVFGTHTSADRRIVSALGGTPISAANVSETNCYGCHTGGTAGNDYYGTKAMTQASRRIQAAFGLTSSHPVDGDGVTSTVECVNCHNAHTVTSGSPVSDPANTYNSYTYVGGTDAQKTAYCLICHDGSGPAYAVGAAYVPATVVVSSPSSNKGGAVAARAHWSSSTASSSIDSGEEVNCAECHDNHASNATKLLGIYNATDGKNYIGGVEITANTNLVCQGCHSAAGATAFTREAGTGYPIEGRWPGMTVYNGTGGIHRNDGDGALVQWSGLGYSDGDCKNCHDVHGTTNTYDELRGTYTKSTFGTCFSCHDGSVSGATDIKQYYLQANGGDVLANTADTNYGHKVQTSGGTLTLGEAVPCYDCHNPHGNANSTQGLYVVTNVNGTTVVIGDAAGEIDMSTAAGERHFCLSCHTAQTASGTPQLQSATNGTAYANITSGTYEGISRVTGSALVLPGFDGHWATPGTQDRCTSCHGADFSGPTSTNVHNPSNGVSNGGMACDSCHKSHATMGGATPDTGTYHHVLDSATPYRAPNGTATYPTSTTALECVSCHVDHDQFNATKGSNLRTSVGSTTGTKADSDFPGSGSYGVCVSCHGTAITAANVNETGQKPGVETNNRAISAIPGATFDVSAHDYLIDDQAKIGFGTAESDTFKANCTKCHDDDMNDASGSKMKSTYKIGVHKASDYRIANALGAAVNGGTYPQTEEDLCYECHSLAANGLKATNNVDGFGAGSMSAKSQAIYNEFQKTYKHPVTSSSGTHKADEGTASNWNPAGSRHVECEDCHNPHAATTGVTAWPTNAAPRANNTVPAIAGSNAGVWGVDVDGNGDANWTGGTATFGSPTAPSYTRLATSAYQWQLCLKCHTTYSWGATAPTVSYNLANQTGGKQTDVGTDFSPKNYSIHPIFAVGKNQPTNASITLKGWSSNQWDNSAGRRNIGGSTSGNALSNTFTDGWLQTSRVVCTDCHNNNTAWSSGPSGPHGSTNRWLLTGADENIKVTIGTTATVQYPNSGITAAGQGANFCLNCHRGDVYGWASNGSGTTNATYGPLSRFDHDTLNAQCSMPNGSKGALNAGLQYSGCLHCHGARKDTASYNNPTSATVQSGAIHGTSMTAPAGRAYSDAMGYRFTNGASWVSHGLGDTATSNGGQIGCQNFTGTGAPGSSDNYSTCAQHGAKNVDPSYYYARPTS